MTNDIKKEMELLLHYNTLVEESKKKIDAMQAAEQASKKAVLQSEASKPTDAAKQTQEVSPENANAVVKDMQGVPPAEKVDVEADREQRRLLKEQAEAKLKTAKVAIIKTQTEPELVTEAWMKKLLPTEQSRILDAVKEHGPYISIRDREILRHDNIIKNKKDGQFYNKIEYENTLFGCKPLTKKQINDLLLDSMENDRLNKIFDETGEWPEWEMHNMTYEEWKAEEPQRRAKADEEYKNRPKLRMKSDWAEIYQKEKGWPPNDRQLHDYMWEHESTEDQRNREIAELDQSSYKSGFKIYDHQIHRVMRWCAALYTFYTWPWTFYATIAVIVIGYNLWALRIYLRWKKEARLPFKPKRRSRHSTEYQYAQWERNRRWWGYDKEDATKPK